jgi:ribosomal protein L37E
MPGPGYKWVCHKCHAENQAAVSACAACGFPAVSSGRAIDPQSFSKSNTDLNHSSSLIIYFPEGLIAGLIVLFAPLWAFGMMIHGQILPAIFLIAATSVLAYWCFIFIRSGARWSAYGTMLGIILVAWLTNSWAPR